MTLRYDTELSVRPDGHEKKAPRYYGALPVPAKLQRAIPVWLRTNSAKKTPRDDTTLRVPEWSQGSLFVVFAQFQKNNTTLRNYATGSHGDTQGGYNVGAVQFKCDSRTTVEKHDAMTLSYGIRRGSREVPAGATLEVLAGTTLETPWKRR